MISVHHFCSYIQSLSLFFETKIRKLLGAICNKEKSVPFHLDVMS